MKNPRSYLALILVLATALRLYKLTAISLWHDEAFSALLINYPWKEMLYRIGLDVHPPVYYILLRIWADIFGHSLFSLRGFSAFFGIATVYAGYLLVREAFNNEKLALFAALLLAVSPFQIQYVTEARMYTFGTFVLLMSGYYLLKSFRSNTWKHWIIFAVYTSLALYTHYYLFFSVFAVGLYGLIYLYKRKQETQSTKYLGKFFAAYALVLLSYLPWLKTFLFQFHQVQQNYWIPKMDKWSIPLTNWRMLMGTGADPAKTFTDFMLTLGLIFSIYLVYRVYKKERTLPKWLILLGLIIPFVGSILLSLKQSIFLDRYFLFAALFYTIALAVFIFEFENEWLRKGLLALFIFLSVFNWAKNWNDLHIDDKPGASAAAAYLNNNVGSNDKLVVGSSFEFFNFKYYNRTGHQPLLYTPGINHVSELPHFSGTALLNDSDLVQNLNAGAKQGTTAWMLWTTGFGGTKPTVPDNWVQIDEQHWQDVRPYTGTEIILDEYRIE